jgi:hypothetical protein
MAHRRKPPLRDIVYLAMTRAAHTHLGHPLHLRTTVGDTGRLIEPTRRERESWIKRRRRGLASAAVTV